VDAIVTEEGILDARDQLIRLLRIQELAIDVSRANETLESAPRRIEEIEDHFRERNAEYVAIKERHEALTRDQKERNAELATLEEKRKKLMEDLMQVKNQREYAAMLKEIDSVKAQIADHEEAVLTDMEEIEKLTGDLANHEEHIQKEREAVERQRVEVESDVAQAREEIESKSAERASVEAELTPDMVASIRRIEGSRQGIFLTKAENATCQSCFVRVRPQVFQEIRTAAAVHTCESCRRFLYYEPALKADAAPNGAGAAAGEGLGAVDGGPA
jgi:predicted  nucleic acid-binding Zn-ribbon protein